MPSAIEQIKAESRAKITAANQRQKSKTLERTLVRKGSLLVSSAIYGTMNRMDVPVALAGFPWKLGVGAIALLGEGMSKGNLQAVLGGVADSTMAIYVERSISTNNLVAGDVGWEDDGSADPDDDDPDGGEI
jgi:hypothetical protein